MVSETSKSARTLASKVAFGDEYHDDCRCVNVFFQGAYVFEVINLAHTVGTHHLRGTRVEEM